METTGLGLAILPLGVKLYNEIRSYLDGLDCADHETSTAAAQLECLASSLDLIEEGLRVEAVEDHVQTTALRQLGLVRVQLEQLGRLVGELTNGEAVSGAASQVQGDQKGFVVSSESWRDRWKQKRKKLAYPFKRANLRRLEDGLANLNTGLTVSLQALDYRRSLIRDAAQVEATSKVLATLSSIQSSIPDAQNITEAMLRLATKPQAVAEASEALGVTNRDVAEATRYMLNPRQRRARGEAFCTCYAKKRRDRSSWALGPVSMTSQNEILDYHDHDCYMRKLQQRQSANTYTVSVRASYRRSMASLISLAVHFSSGGNNQWLRACELRTYNLRSMDRSPIAKLIFLKTFPANLSSTAHRAIAEYWRQGVVSVFASGKASPTDVDSDTGDTALHYLASRYAICAYDQDRQDSTDFEHTMLFSLQELGVPSHQQDKRGMTAADQYLDYLSYQSQEAEEAMSTRSTMLAFMNWENMHNAPTGAQLELHMSPACKPRFHNGLDVAFFMAETFSKNHDILDASNVGPLCRAIILRSQGEGRRIIERDDASWLEKFPGDDSNVCALHLALLWFPSLTVGITKEVVQLHSNMLAKSEDIEGDDATRSLLGAAMLGLALRKERTAPQDWRWSEPCIRDHIQAITWLLQQDCPVFWCGNLLENWPGLDGLGHGTSEAQLLVDAIVSHLADRRRRLRDFAVSRLELAKSMFLGLYNTKLVDGNVLDVLYALGQQDIQIPTALLPSARSSASLLHRVHPAYASRSLTNSVFNVSGLTMRVAEALQEAGFAERGFLRAIFGNPWDHEVSHQAPWLYQLALRDATPSYVSEPLGSFFPKSNGVGEDVRLEIPGWTLLHGFMAVLGHQLTGGDPEWRKDIAIALRPDAYRLTELLNMDLPDDCRCGCTRSGCLPVTSFVGGAGWSRPNPDYYGCMHESIGIAIEASADFLDTLFVESGIPEVLVDAFLRYWTFCYFGCRHTCCKQGMGVNFEGRASDESFRQADNEEHEELRQEDADKLVAVETTTATLLSTFKLRSCTLAQFMVTDWIPSAFAAAKALEDAQNQLPDDAEKLMDLGVTLRFPQPAYEAALTYSDSDPLIPIDVLSDVSSIDLDVASAAEREEWELRNVQVVKRAIDRISGRYCPENGVPTGRVRGQFYGRWHDE